MPHPKSTYIFIVVALLKNNGAQSEASTAAEACPAALSDLELVANKELSDGQDDSGFLFKEGESWQIVLPISGIETPEYILQASLRCKTMRRRPRT